jgi:glyoxylase-like metal-dependent hydrolase (beta-lactamase superfamily II)
MRELAPGLWHWETPHPGWAPSEPWDRSVSSYAIDDGERLLLFDPLGLPNELEKRVGGRESAIVLTAPWHERDTQSLVERLGVPVYTPLPETAEDLMQKYGLTAEQAGEGSPDLAWLVRENKGEAHPYAAGDKPLTGVEAFPSRETNEVVLWVEDYGAVIAGDTLVDFGQGLEIPLQWLREGVTRDQVIRGLRPLLDLPVEHVLATHGGPTDRAALERALS